MSQSNDKRRPAFESEEERWKRVVERRKQECASLDLATVRSMVMEVIGSFSESDSPYERFERLMLDSFQQASNAQLSARRRRHAYNTILQLLKKLNDLVGRKNDEPLDGSTETTSLLNGTSSSHNNVASTAASSSSSSSTPSPAAPTPPPIHTSEATATTRAAPVHHHQPSTTSQNEPSHQGNSTSSQSNRGRTSVTANLAAASAATVAEAASSVPNIFAPRKAPQLAPAPSNASLPSTAVPNDTTTEGHAPPYQRRSDTLQKNHLDRSTSNGVRSSQPSISRGTSSSSSIGATSGEMPINSSNKNRHQSDSVMTSHSDTTTVNHKKRKQSTLEQGNAENGSSQSTVPHGNPLQSRWAPPSKTTTGTRWGPANPPSMPAAPSAPPSTAPTTVAPQQEARPSAYRVELANTEIDFVEDGSAKTKSYANAQLERKPVTIKFHKRWPSSEMEREAVKRLQMWEPNWRIEEQVVLGIMSYVDRLNWKTNSESPNKPKTVGTFDLKIPRGGLYSKLTWGKGSKVLTPKDGDICLMLRMIPLIPEPKANRADCHLWPKGTFMTVNKSPITLQQRKQPSHDYKKWEYQSYPLDLGAHIQNPRGTHTISWCCYDTELYFYHLAICKYIDPVSLTMELVDPSSPVLQRLSLEESTAKAMRLIGQQMVVIDEGDDGSPADDTDQGIGKLVFSLLDPVSKLPMKTPVRGKNCKHWQCFDLESFMRVNAPVSGGRWRCVCCERFVSYQDLQVCTVTQEALEKFKKEVSFTQNRVEFRGDKTYHLLEPQKLRYASKRNGASSGNNAPMQGNLKKNEADIEVIDLD